MPYPTDERGERVRFRLWQIEVLALTLLATCWCVTLGPVPAILAVLAAKHVLVALLVEGLAVGEERQETRRSADASRDPDPARPA